MKLTFWSKGENAVALVASVAAIRSLAFTMIIDGIE